MWNQKNSVYCRKKSCDWFKNWLEQPTRKKTDFVGFNSLRIILSMRQNRHNNLESDSQRNEKNYSGNCETHTISKWSERDMSKKCVKISTIFVECYTHVNLRSKCYSEDLTTLTITAFDNDHLANHAQIFNCHYLIHRIKENIPFA